MASQWVTLPLSDSLRSMSRLVSSHAIRPVFDPSANSDNTRSSMIPDIAIGTALLLPEVPLGGTLPSASCPSMAIISSRKNTALAPQLKQYHLRVDAPLP